MATFLSSRLQFLGAPVTTKLQPMAGVQFGQIFAPHMLQADWTLAQGWGDPRITDFGNISVPPQASGLQYALQCFEGLKAYCGVDGKTIRLFRPEMNARRMQNSMRRLAFPSFDEGEWVSCLKELVKLDREFIPKDYGYSLYLRPSALGTNKNLRVGPSNEVKFFIIASPVGPYYPEGFRPIKLVADAVHKRAWPGGTGEAKLGCNYAGPIYHQVQYAKEGFSQVLWLGVNDVVDEVGAMNFMVLWKNKEGERELITAPLDGTILPGITRDSILTLARAGQWGPVKVTEKRFTIHDICEALRAGRVEEMFGCGTAAIVTAVNVLKYKEDLFDVPCPEDSLAKRILKTVLDIQYGVLPHEWSVVVE